MIRTRTLLLLFAAIGCLYGGVSVAVPMFAAMPYTSECTAISNVALSTTHEVVFAATPGRKEWCISNNDTSIAIYVAQHTTSTSADVRVGPGQAICGGINGGWIHEGVIDALAASSTPAIGGYQCK